MDKHVQASLTGDVYKDFNLDSEESMYFVLQDSVHLFTIGLSDILLCLKFAEEEGEVPELSQFWWDQLAAIYPKLERPLDTDDSGEKTDDKI